MIAVALLFVDVTSAQKQTVSSKNETEIRALYDSWAKRSRVAISKE